MDKRYAKVRWGNFPRARTGAKTWNDPHRWNKQAVVDGDRPFVFCASLADIFDNQVPTQWRTDAFEVMRNTPRLVYLLLTKRPQNIVRLSMEAGGLPVNAALGTTCEDQPRADKNLPALLSAHDRVNSLFTFLSCEPLLGPIDLSQFDSFPDWVIAGGETDQGEHKARPTHPDWLRDLRDACAQVGVPFHLKQWGEWTPGENVPHTVRGRRPSAHFFDGEWDIGSTDMSDPEDGWMDEPDVYRVGKKLSGRMLDGVTHDAFPQVPA